MSPDPSPPTAAERRAVDAAIETALTGARTRTVEDVLIVVDDDGYPRRHVPDYSSDSAASDALEAELGRRGLGERYALKLMAMQPGFYAGACYHFDDIWKYFLYAPLLLKAQAALAVLREAKP